MAEVTRLRASGSIRVSLLAQLSTPLRLTALAQDRLAGSLTSIGSPWSCDSDVAIAVMPDAGQSP
jgi:hypothetical protein